jgi:hypothetical protein
VSADAHAGTPLAQKPMDTVDNLSNGIKATSYGFSRSDVSQFCAHSPAGGSAVNQYYDSLKPFVLVMRAMGVLPLSSEAGGKY